MRAQQAEGWTRRRFIGGLTVAGAAGLLGLHARPVAAEPPPEVTTLRLTAQRGGICIAPKYVAEELLQVEGFTDIRYVEGGRLSVRMRMLATGESDLEVTFVGPFVTRLDAGDPTVILAGAHVGCFELFGTERVRAIRDLKGKTMAISGVGEPDHAFLASLLTYIGLDPRKDINWVIHPPAEAMELLAEEKIDAWFCRKFSLGCYFGYDLPLPPSVKKRGREDD
jgi:NitT/TauT family transport system substrate-binding protein